MPEVNERHIAARCRFHGNYIPEPNSGCWLWTRFVSPDGYGRIRVGNKKTMLAHRFSYELHKGKIEDGALVRHRCDTPSCVNPDHLLLGTYQDNKNDAVEKRRHAHGTTNHNAKLTDKTAMEIFQSEKPRKYLAERYGVSLRTVRAIKYRQRWKHIHSEVKDESRTGF